MTDAIGDGFLAPGICTRSDTEGLEDMAAGLTTLPMFRTSVRFPDLSVMGNWEDIVDSDPETRGLRDVPV
jgi:hypothetical protein